MNGFSEEKTLSLVAQIKDWQVSLDIGEQTPRPPPRIVRMGSVLRYRNRVSDLRRRNFDRSNIWANMSC